ncbi:DUF721 domain-containing protein [Algihabitans albus]|uniref:DUF721 domain-containing protein n=1 Tax=Algihabitans albus TaxID=2164067 RepID=UPI0013C337AC|nr:DciA family protein [Algihabitans albus]
MTAVARPLNAITRPLLKSRSAVEATLLLEWGRIVGSETALNTRPEKLRFAGPKSPESGRSAGTLYLLVAPGFAPELQHSSRQVIERINGYLGWGAVARLALRQGPIPRTAEPRRPKPRRLSPQEEADIEAATADIRDERLRGALTRLARAVKAKAQT